VTFAVSGALLDACVLGVLSASPTYGYHLTQRIQTTIDVSESTLYPVLRRLLKEEFLFTFDEAYDGRNRRYYTLTDKGKIALKGLVADWTEYKASLDKLLMGELDNEKS